MHSRGMNTTTNPPDTQPEIAQVIHRHKLPLNADPENAEQFQPVTLMIPAGFQVTAIQPTKAIKGDGGAAVEIYTLANPHAEPEPRTFKIVRTGEEMPHCGSAAFHITMAYPGMPAIHLFEIF